MMILPQNGNSQVGCIMTELNNRIADAERKNFGMFYKFPATTVVAVIFIVANLLLLSLTFGYMKPVVMFGLGALVLAPIVLLAAAFIAIQIDIVQYRKKKANGKLRLLEGVSAYWPVLAILSIPTLIAYTKLFCLRSWHGLS